MSVQLANRCDVLSDVYVWNSNGKLGWWVRLPHASYGTFHTTSYPGRHRFHNFDMGIWAGHVIKLSFNCHLCSVVKFQGQIKYPWHTRDFFNRSSRVDGRVGEMGEARMSVAVSNMSSSEQMQSASDRGTKGNRVRLDVTVPMILIIAVGVLALRIVTAIDSSETWIFHVF